MLIGFHHFCSIIYKKGELLQHASCGLITASSQRLCAGSNGNRRDKSRDKNSLIAYSLRGCHIFQALPGWFPLLLCLPLLDFIFFEFDQALIKKCLISIWEYFPHIQRQTLNSLVPVTPCISLQSWENYRQNNFTVLCN